VRGGNLVFQQKGKGVKLNSNRRRRAVWKTFGVQNWKNPHESEQGGHGEKGEKEMKSGSER